MHSILKMCDNKNFVKSTYYLLINNFFKRRVSENFQKREPIAVGKDRDDNPIKLFFCNVIRRVGDKSSHEADDFSSYLNWRFEH